MEIPELGVGIIYFSGFESILESNLDLIQVVEIEPQTFWYRNKSKLDSYSFDENTVNYLLEVNKPTLFHGVGYPVGGKILSDTTHMKCFKDMATILNPIWFSEHLSFNTIEIEGQLCNTNFLLPPLQTNEGVETYIRNIKEYSKKLNIPFAFETGTNYLSPKKFEIEDGTFINKISEGADCNILLDLHNILANEKNGRQKVKDFIRQISLERVIQIHLAGGFYFKDYYLDAHSGISSDEVISIFESIVKTLPNLKAITFEMLPDYLRYIPEKDITIQLEKMNRIWDKRGSFLKIKPKNKEKKVDTFNSPTLNEWENTLGLLTIGRTLNSETKLSMEFKEDRGLEVITDLVEKFRGSFLVSSLKLTCRYIMLHYGLDKLDYWMKKFWLKSIPELFSSDNGLNFANYLLENSEAKKNRILMDIILYESSSLQTLLDNNFRQINICFNPNEIVPLLVKGLYPTDLVIGEYLVKIEPQQEFNDSVNSVFHS
jgi:uncharacterized protein